MSWKAFREKGLNALLISILQTKQTADGNTSAVSGLSKDLQDLAQHTVAAVTELDANKAEKTAPVSFAVPSSGWKQDETEGYPYYCDLPAVGVTAADRVDVTIAVSGLAAAVQCGLCPTCETLKDVIRLRAASVPVTSIAAGYTINQGKEQ